MKPTCPALEIVSLFWERVLFLIENSPPWLFNDQSGLELLLFKYIAGIIFVMLRLLPSIFTPPATVSLNVDTDSVPIPTCVPLSNIIESPKVFPSGVHFGT